MAIDKLSNNGIEASILPALSGEIQNGFKKIQPHINNSQANDAALNHLTNHLDDSFLVATIKPGEIGWALASPMRAYLGSQAADTATETASRLFSVLDPGRTHSADDNEQNAFKHAYWNALMVKSFANYESASRGGGGDLDSRLMKGAVWARRFADAHEQDIPFAPANTQAQHDMDYYNNRVGREIAIRVLKENPNASDEDLANAVMDAVRNGHLKVLKREYPI